MEKSKLKIEAIKRMKYLKLLPNVIEDFEDTGRLYMSERQNKMFLATLYYFDDKDLLQEVENFENEYDYLVYHVQLTHTMFGDMYSFLYVSCDEDEWDLDWEDMKNEKIYAYVVNGDIKEIGAIGISPYMGGVARVW